MPNPKIRRWFVAVRHLRCLLHSGDSCRPRQKRNFPQPDRYQFRQKRSSEGPRPGTPDQLAEAQLMIFAPETSPTMTEVLSQTRSPPCLLVVSKTSARLRLLSLLSMSVLAAPNSGRNSAVELLCATNPREFPVTVMPSSRPMEARSKRMPLPTLS